MKSINIVIFLLFVVSLYLITNSFSFIEPMLEEKRTKYRIGNFIIDIRPIIDLMNNIVLKNLIYTSTKNTNQIDYEGDMTLAVQPNMYYLDGIDIDLFSSSENLNALDYLLRQELRKASSVERDTTLFKYLEDDILIRLSNQTLNNIGADILNKINSGDDMNISCARGIIEDELFNDPFVFKAINKLVDYVNDGVFH